MSRDSTVEPTKKHHSPKESAAIMNGNTNTKLNILELEKSLGIWWSRGLSRQKDARKIPVIGNLLHDIDRITQTYGGLAQRDIRRSTDLRKAASATFAVLGSDLWPDADKDRSAWLVADAAVDDLGGLYPKNLYFSDPKDREKLHNLFSELIVAKCVRYYENHGRHWHYEFDHHGGDGSMLLYNADTTELGDDVAADHEDQKDRGSHPTPLAKDFSHPSPAQPKLVDDQLDNPRPELNPQSSNANTVAHSNADDSQTHSRETVSTAPLPTRTRTRSPEPDRLTKRPKLPDQISPPNTHEVVPSSHDSHHPRTETSLHPQHNRSLSHIPYEILGEFVSCPSVIKILQSGHTDGISREHWAMLRAVLMAHPAAREDSALLHTELSRLDEDSTNKGIGITLPAVRLPQASAGEQPMTMPVDPARDHHRVSRAAGLSHLNGGNRPPLFPLSSNGNGTDGRLSVPTQLPQQQPYLAVHAQPPRPSWPSLGNSPAAFPRMNIWLRLKDTLGRSAITLEKLISVFDMFLIAEQRMSRKLNGRPIVSLTFTYVGRSIEDDPIEVEAQDQVTWDALIGLVLSFRGSEPIELRAIIDF